MSIVKDCMIVNLQVGIWLGYRLDKEASRALVKQAGADEDAARVNKHLLPKEDLRPVITAANALRSHFYTNTLPWKDNGDRLLTRKRYMRFIEDHSNLEKDFHREVDILLKTSYPRAREQAEFRMGDLFKSEDYPPPRDLVHRFYVNLDIDAVTEAHDFRVEMEQSQLDSIRRKMEDALRQRLQRAMTDVWERLATTLGHFAEKMEGDAIFRDSTVHNLQELVDLLPDLNVLEDPDLERIRQDIAKNLTGYEPADLRKHKGVRDGVKREAARIMDDMEGFMRAFGKAA